MKQKSTHLKVVSFLLAVTMLFGMCFLTSCKSNFWHFSKSDIKNANELVLTVKKGEKGKYVINARSQNDVFKSDMQNNCFCIIGVSKTVKQIAAESLESNNKVEKLDDEYIADNSMKSTYKYVDAKHAQFIVDDSKGLNTYNLYVHKTATVDGNYAAGIYEKQYDVAEITELTSSADVNAYRSNPNLNLTLSNAKFGEKISKDSLTFSQGFSSLKVKEIKRVDDNRIIVSTTGKLKSNYSLGTVACSANALNGTNSPVTANVSILNAKVYADYTSMKFSGGLLSLNIILAQSTFENAPKVSISGVKGVSVQSVDTAKGNSTALITLKVNAKDIDNAAEKIMKSTLNISSDSTSYKKALSLKLVPEHSILNSSIDLIEKPEKGSNTYSASAFLTASAGSLKTLKASDISIGGNFKNAKISEVKEVNGGAKIKFTFTLASNTSANSFSGKISVASGKLVNLWGTASSNTVSNVRYAFDEFRDNDDVLAPIAAAEGLEELAQTTNIVQKANKYLTFCATVDSYIVPLKWATTITGITKDIYAACQFFGTTQGTSSSQDEKLDQIISSINAMQTDVDAIKTKLDGASIQLQNIDKNVNISVYNTAATNWNSFYYDDYTALKNIINNYQQSFDNEIFLFINAVQNETPDENMMTVYTNNDNEMLIPKTKGGSVAIDNGSITNKSDYTIPKDIFKRVAKGSNNFKNSYKDMKKDLELDLEDEFPNGVGTDIYNSLILQINYKIMQQSNLKDADTKFANFCDQLSAKSLSESPMYFFDEMLKFTYNFSSQIEEKQTSMRNEIKQAILSGSAIAKLAKDFSYPANPQTNTVDEKAAAATKIVTDESYLNTVNDGEEWCLQSNSAVKLGYYSFTTLDAMLSVNGTSISGSTNISNGSISALPFSQAPAVTSNQIAMMNNKALARGTTLSADLLDAGFDKNLVSKSKWIVSSAVSYGKQSKVSNNNMMCYLPSNSSYKEGSIYTDLGSQDYYVFHGDIIDSKSTDMTKTVRESEEIITRTRVSNSIFQSTGWANFIACVDSDITKGANFGNPKKPPTSGSGSGTRVYKSMFANNDDVYDPGDIYLYFSFLRFY